MKKFIKDADAGLLRLFAIMIIAFVLMVVLVPNTSLFLKWSNFQSMMFQLPEIGILTVAVMFAMLLGGIDLSVVGIANLSGILCSIVILNTYERIGAVSILLGCVTALAVGVGCGAFNGFIVSKLGVPAMLATLGTMQMFSGIGIAITKGAAVVGLPDEYGKIGSLMILGVPLIMWIFMIVVLMTTIILQKRKIGWEIYLLGTSEKSARFTGIKNVKVTLQTFMISGFLSSIAGIILTSRSMSAKADYGSSYILQCLLVAILGGISPFGGFGKVVGIVISIITLQIISSGFNMLRFSSYQKTFIWGLVLIFAMIINYYAEQRKLKKKTEKERN